MRTGNAWCLLKCAGCFGSGQTKCVVVVFGDFVAPCINFLMVDLRVIPLSVVPLQCD